MEHVTTEVKAKAKRVRKPKVEPVRVFRITKTVDRSKKALEMAGLAARIMSYLEMYGDRVVLLPSVKETLLSTQPQPFTKCVMSWGYDDAKRKATITEAHKFFNRQFQCARAIALEVGEDIVNDPA